MGYRTGQIVVRVMNGESPARIPIQSMSDAKVDLNLDAAAKQGVEFPGPVLRRAARIIRASSAPGPVPEAGNR